MLRRIKNDKPDSSARQPSDAVPVADASMSGVPAPALDDVSSKGRAARLGDILLEERIITAKQLNEGLAKQKEMGGFLGQALVELGHIDQDTLTLILVKQCKIPHLNLHEYSISNEVLSLIPPELCAKYHLLPVDKMGKILTVAMVDPLDVDALAAIRGAFPDLRIKPILCDWPHFLEVFKRIESAQSPGASVPAPAIAQESIPGAKPQAPVVQPTAKAPAPIPAPTPSAKPAAPVEIPVVAVAAPVAEIDTDKLAVAIRASLHETMSVFEQRLAEAAELLRAVQETEKNMVETQNRNDLGIPAPAPIVRHIERVVALAPAATTNGAGAEADARVLDDLERGTPRTAYSFETFFVGAANRTVLDMAKTVAGGGGKEFNPLFLCGDVGLGKTHLISAIGIAMLARDASLRIGWTSAGRFADHAVAALEEKAQEDFRQAYSQWDALILDDIQFLGGRIEAQEELFHVFNALLERGRQIVIAGDRMPDKLGLLEKRLVSRFDSGQVVRIQAPEWETRVQILKHHAKSIEAAAPDEVLAMLAMRYPADVRRLIGALRKVAARAKLQGGSITAALAGEILAESNAEAAA
jgi:chromosomal replication initiator protein DnaA